MADVSSDAPAPAAAPIDAPTPAEASANNSKANAADSTTATNSTPNGSNNKDAVSKDAPNQGKKDRKPRRQGLPLPDPIPEAPVKRYPEPSKTELQAKIDAEDVKIQACFDRLNATRDFYNQRNKIRDETKPAFDEARKLLLDLNDQTRTLFDERKALTARIKDIRDADVAARGPGKSVADIPGVGKDGNDALKDVRTIKQLEDKIKELEYRQETESMHMHEEKRIVAQISFLNHKGRDVIRERDQTFQNERAAKETRITNRKELEEARTKLDARIDATKAKLDAQRKIVDDIRAKQEEDIKKLEDTSTTIDRDGEKKKIAELKAVIRKIRDEFQTELDKYYLNERIHYEQQKIAKRKKYEAMQAEREARRKAWEAEQAQYPEPHPYQEEKDLCSGLVVYLQTLLGETIEKPSVNLRGDSTAPSLKNGSVREVSVKNVKEIGKSTMTTDAGFGDLAFSDFVKKSGKKGKKGRRAGATATPAETPNEEDAMLKPHSIDYLAAFTKLEIKSPNKMSEVRAALEAVRSKLSFYETAPAPTAEEKAERAKKNNENKPKKAQTGGSEKANGVANLLSGDANEGMFPGLGSGAPSRARDESLPSFKAVASGAVSAPAPPVPSMLGDMNNNGDNDEEGTDMPESDAMAAGAGEGGIVPQPEPSMAEA